MTRKNAPSHVEWTGSWESAFQQLKAIPLSYGHQRTCASDRYFWTGCGGCVGSEKWFRVWSPSCIFQQEAVATGGEVFHCIESVFGSAAKCGGISYLLDRETFYSGNRSLTNLLWSTGQDWIVGMQMPYPGGSSVTNDFCSRKGRKECDVINIIIHHVVAKHYYYFIMLSCGYTISSCSCHCWFCSIKACKHCFVCALRHCVKKLIDISVLCIHSSLILYN